MLLSETNLFQKKCLYLFAVYLYDLCIFFMSYLRFFDLFIDLWATKISRAKIFSTFAFSAGYNNNWTE